MASPPPRVRAAVPAVRAAAPVVLVVVATLLVAELLRGIAPLLDLVASRQSVLGAAALGLAICAAPVLCGPLVALVGAARATVAALAALSGLRLVVQAQDPPTLPVVGAAAALGVAALVLAVRQVVTLRSGVAACAGVLYGLAADVAVRTAYGSWDPLFRPGLGSWLAPAAACAVLLVAVVVAAPVLTGPTVAGRAGALGPYLALAATLYGSAPVLAAHAGVGLPVAAAVLIATAVTAAEVVRRLALPGGDGTLAEPRRWFAGGLALLGLAGAVTLAYATGGWWAVAGCVVAGWAGAVLLARALTPRPGARSRRPAVGYAVAAGAVGLGYLAPVLVYQVNYEFAFPFDNRAVLVAAAVLLGLAGLGVRPPADRAPRRTTPLRLAPAPATVVASVALLVPLAVVVVQPAPSADWRTAAVESPTAGVRAGADPPATLQVMSWNVRYARDQATGVVDPAAIAAAVAEVDPDVLLLQEVGRGWPLGGGTDLAYWLARRLDMPYVWAPAADAQFGNAVFSRLPVGDVATGRLPFGQGPMHRSYAAVTVPLAGVPDGVRLFSTHLQHRVGNTPTRLAQTAELLSAWGGRAHTVVGGDFNSWPGWPAERQWRTAGFRSAQDVAGDPDAFTAPSDAPDNRIDYVFGTPDLRFTEFHIRDDVTVSDHLPLVVTVAAAGGSGDERR